MGKGRQKRNWQARQVVEVKVDSTEQDKIKVDLPKEDKYDESNPMVLPSTKRKTKKLKNANPVRILSKKQRKKLEKILEKKTKKQNREKLLYSLVEIQSQHYDSSVLTSLQDTQTRGRRGGKKKDKILPLEDNEGPKKRSCEADMDQKSKRLKADPVLDEVETTSEEETDEMDEGEQAVKAILNKTSEKLVEPPKPPSPTPQKLVIKPEDHKPAAFKILDRLPEVVEARSNLPVVSMEYEIMSAIRSNTFVIITGTTGSGKTTQVPQFLYEAGFTSNGMKIGVTEPRRVAAISMAERVGYEMNLSAREVSYQVRFEGNTTKDTQLKFMTDGTFLKEIQSDPMLNGYSAVIIDEAHERSVNSDIIIGYLSRLALRRGKPKVIIMSATLDQETFLSNPRLFPTPPPVVEVESRMYEVVVHHNRKTPEDYMEEAFKKTCQIHRKLPAGGILVFLTGKEEVISLCNRLKNTFPMWTETKQEEEQTSEDAVMVEKESQTEEKSVDKEAIMDKTSRDVVDGFNDFDGNLEEEEEEALFKEQQQPRLKCSSEREQPLYVLPMYALLEASKQKLIFQPPPEGTRLCVVATNVAETSLTIPNIVYVVDSGKIKQNNYNPVTGVSHLQVEWTSQASANQRKGRAGRTQKGHCYRLYSSMVFTNDLPPNPIPDILRQPIEDLILSLKSIRAPILSFPFPQAPPEDQVNRSIQHLLSLGALTKVKGKKCPYSITPTGERMCKLPVSPRFAKMMILSCKHPGLLPYVILLVCILSTKEVLVNPSLALQDDEANDISSSYARSGSRKLLGDLYVLLIATCNEDEAVHRGVRPKAMSEINKLRRQLINKIKLLNADIDVELKTTLDLPSPKQCLQLRRIVLAGSTSNIARKIRPHEMGKESKRKSTDAYRLLHTSEPAYLTFTCPLKKDAPSWIVYQDSYRNDTTGRVFLRGVTAIDPNWIPEVAPDLCSYSAPLDTPPPSYSQEKDAVMCSVDVNIEKLNWVLPAIKTPYPVCNDLYKMAAYFFLEGQICPLLKQFAPYLNNTKLVINPIAVRLRKERQDLTNALKALAPPNFKSLEAFWQKEPKYLYKEYIAWVSKDHEDQIEKIKEIWPPCDIEED